MLWGTDTVTTPTHGVCTLNALAMKQRRSRCTRNTASRHAHTHTNYYTYRSPTHSHSHTQTSRLQTALPHQVGTRPAKYVMMMAIKLMPLATDRFVRDTHTRSSQNWREWWGTRTHQRQEFWLVELYRVVRAKSVHVPHGLGTAPGPHMHTRDTPQPLCP
jgi:hypothetical protein